MGNLRTSSISMQLKRNEKKTQKKDGKQHTQFWLLKINMYPIIAVHNFYVTYFFRICDIFRHTLPRTNLVHPPPPELFTFLTSQRRHTALHRHREFWCNVALINRATDRWGMSTISLVEPITLKSSTKRSQHESRQLIQGIHLFSWSLCDSVHHVPLTAETPALWGSNRHWNRYFS